MEDAFLPVYSKVMYYSIGSGRSYNYNVNAISLRGMPIGVVGVYNKPTQGHTTVSQKNKGAEKESSVVLRRNFYILLHVSELYRI